jgi:hypothetical protein
MVVLGGLIALSEVGPIRESSVGSGEWWWALLRLVLFGGIAVVAALELVRLRHSDREADGDTPPD